MKKLTIFLGAFALGAQSLFGQVELTDRASDDATAVVEFDAISFASDSAHMSRLDVYIAVPYELLSFVKKDDVFAASYEITIDLYDAKDALVNEKLWSKEITVPTFDQSVSPTSFAIEQRSLMISPGDYKILLILRDLESRQTRKISKQLVISDYSREGVFLSDIMLINRFAVREDGKKSITPSISSNVGNISSPFHVFFETYNLAKAGTVFFETTIYNQKNEQVLKSDTSLQVNAGRGQVFLKVDQSALPIGDYRFFIQAFAEKPAPEQKPLATTSRAFVVRWAGMPKGVKDIDMAIEQIAYIAKDNELSHIKDAETAEEKQKRFFEFWKKKDPNPNTVRNERMEEHYARVEYANKHFKHYSQGWRTDMGMVYIIFGAPNNVDRHPFDSDSKPYEVWSYYEINYSFVFVDQTGFGDYRLITPLWDVWQRPRN